MDEHIVFYESGSISYGRTHLPDYARKLWLPLDIHQWATIARHIELIVAIDHVYYPSNLRAARVRLHDESQNCVSQPESV